MGEGRREHEATFSTDLLPPLCCWRQQHYDSPFGFTKWMMPPSDLNKFTYTMLTEQTEMIRGNGETRNASIAPGTLPTRSDAP
jgi:hypothetical protein